MSVQSLHVEQVKADHCGERGEEPFIRFSSSSEKCAEADEHCQWF